MFVTTLQAHQKYKTVKNSKCQNELCTIQKLAPIWLIPTRPALVGVVGTKNPINFIRNGKLSFGHTNPGSNIIGTEVIIKIIKEFSLFVYKPTNACPRKATQNKNGIKIKNIEGLNVIL